MTRLNALYPLAAAALLSLTAACGNPTVDPTTEFTLVGKALTADGQPLNGAEVRLMGYYSPFNALTPSIDQLLRCKTGSCNNNDVGLELRVVKATTTGMDGRYTIVITGADLQAEAGVTDSMGKVEVVNTVALVMDPADMDARAGVMTYDFTFSEATRTIGPPDLKLWKSDATIDVGGVATTGRVKFTWNKLERGSGSRVRNIYGVDIRGPNARLLLTCTEDSNNETEGGCVTDGSKISTFASAFSIYNFYSNRGTFSAYIEGDGMSLRYRSKFAAMSIPDPTPTRDKVTTQGVWAVGPSSEQDLTTSRATDGDAATRETITNQATAVYVRLAGGAVVSDAGVMNSLVKDANEACVIVEFAVTAYNSIGAAKGSMDTEWTKKGKFCGSNGADNEISALAAFDTSQADGIQAAWLRYRLDGSSSTYFVAIGEVAVYKKK